AIKDDFWAFLKIAFGVDVAFRCRQDVFFLLIVFGILACERASSRLYMLLRSSLGFLEDSFDVSIAFVFSCEFLRFATSGIVVVSVVFRWCS
ncbi:2981_t:CDS:1, partial [Gigaspora rosea]